MSKGKITIVKLKTEGRLCAGDTISTTVLGLCTVTTICSAHSITVTCNADGTRWELSGLQFDANTRIETRVAQ